MNPSFFLFLFLFKWGLIFGLLYLSHYNVGYWHVLILGIHFMFLRLGTEVYDYTTCIHALKARDQSVCLHRIHFMPLRLGTRLYSYTTCINANEAWIGVFAYTTWIVIVLPLRIWNEVFAYNTMHCIAFHTLVCGGMSFCGQLSTKLLKLRKLYSLWWFHMTHEKVGWLQVIGGIEFIFLDLFILFYYFIAFPSVCHRMWIHQFVAGLAL